MRRKYKNAQTSILSHRLPPARLSRAHTAQTNPPHALEKLPEARHISPLIIALRRARQRPEVLEHGNRNGAFPDGVAARCLHGWQARAGALGGVAVVEFEAGGSVAEVVAVGEGLDGLRAVVRLEGWKDPVESAGAVGGGFERPG